MRISRYQQTGGKYHTPLRYEPQRASDSLNARAGDTSGWSCFAVRKLSYLRFGKQLARAMSALIVLSPARPCIDLDRSRQSPAA